MYYLPGHFLPILIFLATSLLVMRLGILPISFLATRFSIYLPSLGVDLKKRVNICPMNANFTEFVIKIYPKPDG